MLTTTRKEIDGLTFELGMLGVKDSRAVLVRLARVLGPSLAELARPGTSLKDERTIAGALGKFASSISEEDLEYLCAKFGSCSKVQVGGLMVAVSGAGETVFLGRLATMFKWLWACAEVNYSDFLAPLSTMFDRVSPEKTESKSTSPAE